MPPNAPSGATHMISRMIPKTTREAHLEDAHDRLALAVGEHRDRRGDEDREHQDRQDLVLDERGDEAGRQQVVGDEADEAGRGVAGLGDRLLGRLLRRGARLAVEAGARREDVGHEQAERQRDHRHREEVGQRAQREPARAREVAERGDADHDREEDHRAGDGLDQLDEGVGEPLGLLRRARRDKAEDDPRHDRHDDPEPQLLEDSPLSHVEPSTRPLNFPRVRPIFTGDDSSYDLHPRRALPAGHPVGLRRARVRGPAQAPRHPRRHPVRPPQGRPGRQGRDRPERRHDEPPVQRRRGDLLRPPQLRGQARRRPARQPRDRPGRPVRRARGLRLLRRRRGLPRHRRAHGRRGQGRRRPVHRSTRSCTPPAG